MKVEDIFNRLRPKYPIKPVLDTIVGMKENFENITKRELKAIKDWTDDSSDIKSYMWGITDKVSDTTKQDAKILNHLFTKYNSNIEKGISIYRGMSLDKSMILTLGYNEIQKGDLFTPDDKAIVSFSTDKRVAYDFANDTDREFKIIIKTLTLGKNEFDISKISTKPEQKETILSKNLWYNVRNVKRIDKWLLIELEEEN